MVTNSFFTFNGTITTLKLHIHPRSVIINQFKFLKENVVNVATASFVRVLAMLPLLITGN